MSETAAELRATLLRQRRFLTLMSLAVIGFYALGIEPKDEANVVGLGLKITQPSRLDDALWLVWAWSLWRYVQRIYEMLSVIWGELVDDVYAEDRRMAVARAKKIGNRLAADGKIEELPNSARIDGDVKIVPPTPEELRSVIGEKITSYRDFVPTPKGGRRYPALTADFEWQDGITWERTDQRFTMELTHREHQWLRVRAWLHSILRLPSFSEHIAPIILALAAVGAWLIHL